MKNAIVLGLVVCFGIRLTAAEPLTSETFLTKCGVYQRTVGSTITELLVQTNELRIANFDPAHRNSAGAAAWNPGPNWFIYIDKNLHAWAYNGDRGLWLLKADRLGSQSISIEKLEEQPPAAVVRRLPADIRKLIPQNPKP